MKKGALIALIALATSLAVYAEGGERGKKKNKKKEKAKIECCNKSKCSKEEKPNNCVTLPGCSVIKN